MEDASAPRPGFFSRLLKGDARTKQEPVRTVRVSVNAYGKLPIYKDFISSGLTEPGAREFRNWIDRGFSHLWSSDDARKERDIARHVFLLRLPESGAYVAGCLWGSGDAGGLRRFPFTLFTVLPGGHRAADLLAATEHLEVFNRQADAVAERFGPGGSLDGFYRTYRGAELDLPVKPAKRIEREARAELEGVPIASLARGLFAESAATRWPALLSGLDQAADPSAPTATPTLLPLSGALPRPRELQFWLLRLSRAGSRRRDVDGILYHARGERGRALLLWRGLRAEDFLSLDTRPSEPEPPAASPASSESAAPTAGFEQPLSSLLSA